MLGFQNWHFGTNQKEPGDIGDHSEDGYKVEAGFNVVCGGMKTHIYNAYTLHKLLNR